MALLFSPDNCFAIDIGGTVDFGYIAHESNEYKNVEDQTIVDSASNAGGIGLDFRVGYAKTIGLYTGAIANTKAFSGGWGAYLGANISVMRVEAQSGKAVSAFKFEDDLGMDDVYYQQNFSSIFIGYIVEDRQDSQAWLGIKYSRFEVDESKLVGQETSDGYYDRNSIGFVTYIDLFK